MTYLAKVYCKHFFSGCVYEEVVLLDELDVYDYLWTVVLHLSLLKLDSTQHNKNICINKRKLKKIELFFCLIPTLYVETIFQKLTDFP